MHCIDWLSLIFSSACLPWLSSASTAMPAIQSKGHHFDIDSLRTPTIAWISGKKNVAKNGGIWVWLNHRSMMMMMMMMMAVAVAMAMAMMLLVICPWSPDIGLRLQEFWSWPRACLPINIPSKTAGLFCKEGRCRIETSKWGKSFFSNLGNSFFSLGVM